MPIECRFFPPSHADHQSDLCFRGFGYSWLSETLGDKLSTDGNIDYSRYSYREILEALDSINSRKYPKNYANLQAALEAIGPTQREALAQDFTSDPPADVPFATDDRVQPDPDTRRVNHLVTAITVAGISAYLLWVDDLTLPFSEPLKISLIGIGKTLGNLAFLFAIAVPASFIIDYADHRDNRQKYLLFAMFAESIASALLIFAAFISASPTA